MPIPKIVNNPTRQDHLAMMRDESDWPAWPFLPLKHATRKDPIFPAMPETGMLATGHGAQVFLGNIFFGINENTPSIMYDSFEAVLDDGWVVD